MTTSTWAWRRCASSKTDTDASLAALAQTLGMPTPPLPAISVCIEKIEGRRRQEIDQKRKLTMMTLFTLRWGRLKKKTKVAPEPA